MRMRAIIEGHRPVALDSALCRECHDRLDEQTIRNYRALERFHEGTRFPEDLGVRSASYRLWVHLTGGRRSRARSGSSSQRG